MPFCQKGKTDIYVCQNFPTLTGLIVHHSDGFGLGQFQRCDPSLPLHLCAGFQMVSAPPTAQNNIAGVFGVDVRRGQVDGAAARMGHLCLRPIKSDEDRRSNQNMESRKWEGGERDKKTKNQRKTDTGNNEEKKREKRKVINNIVKWLIQMSSLSNVDERNHTMQSRSYGWAFLLWPTQWEVGNFPNGCNLLIDTNKRLISLKFYIFIQKY